MIPIKSSLLLFVFTAILSGETRRSDDFEIITESPASGIPQSSGGDLVLDSSLDPSSGEISSSADFTLKPGYLGQIYDIAELTVSANSATLAEGTETQLSAEARLDDDTLLSLDPLEVDWSSSPDTFLSIDEAGLAGASFVFQNETAAAEGSYQGVTGFFPISILNTGSDNFLSYGSDGIDDSWQVANFGAPPNADAGPGKNPDNDPYDNTFEFLTGSNPNDRNDFLRFEILGREENSAMLRFSKVIPGTRYMVLRSGGLNDIGSFSEFTDSVFTVAEEQSDFILSDNEATSDEAYYLLRVEPE